MVIMRKPTIVKFFLGSLVGMAASVVLLIVAGALALGSDVFIMDGPDVVGVKAGAFGWTMLGLVAVAVLGILAALGAQVVSWVGAVLNTAQLPDKTWFVVVLVGGLVSLGFIATLAYVIGGPDGERQAVITQHPAVPDTVDVTKASPEQQQRDLTLHG